MRANSVTPQVSLIIAVYQRPDFLSLILQSCLNQSFKEFEILVADDGSGAEIAEVIERFSQQCRFPIRHIRHDHDGFRKTIIINETVRHASSDYLVFIDGDCILHHRFIERHYRHRQRGEVLSGRRVTLDPAGTAKVRIHNVLSRAIQKPSFWWSHTPARERRHGIYLHGSFVIENLFKKNYWIFGSNFSLYKSDFLAINGYDETITGRGGEDLNLSERIKMKGLRIRTITREALQYHLFHHADPIPHDAETFQRIMRPISAFAAEGITRS